jgi:O-acetyl-ADP-ribose deacetylase (regulator of RNase III)
MPKKKPEVKGLYYITHIANLPSILERGILAHRRVEEAGIPYTRIYDAAIVTNRGQKTTPDGRSLWDFANLYFQVRNPMLYRVLHEKDASDIAVVGVHPSAVREAAAFVSLGNAASAATEILPGAEGLDRISEIWDVISSDWWNAVDGSKRKIMAECLVPGSVSPERIHSIYVSSHGVAEKVKSMHLVRAVPVIPEPHMFFLPARRYRVSDHLSLAEGDMFFSTMQTLTVSVNVVGIMGKGLASRAKYQFPDVYVLYQDACRRKRLRMGRPYLYKREAFVDQELAEEPGTLPEPNANKWFLLFATKKHWRDTSDLAGIAEGLRWVRDNYKAEGIKSLAMPALGCGLGRLEWRDVGPVMCRTLSSMDIPVAIYLPREREIPGEFLSPEYLLAASQHAAGGGLTTG